MLYLLSVATWAATWDGATLDRRLAEIDGLRALRIAADRPALPASDRGRAAAGEIVTGLVAMPGSAARLGWGMAVVDVGIDRMFAALADDARKPQYSSLEATHQIGGAPCGDRRRVFQYLPMPVVSDRWWVVDQAVNRDIHAASAGAVRETTWNSVQGDLALPPEVQVLAAKGVRVAFTRGAWFLVALAPDRTWVEYHAWSDPGGSVPASVASRFAASGIPDAIEGMVRLARAGPGCAAAP